MPQRRVFISYAREDRPDVEDSAALLRAGGVSIFIDVHDIDYGERWKDALQQALQRCERVLVFWSRAAQASQWVDREWRFALALGKKIVPTLLDATPLPAELAEFQAVSRQRRPPAPADAAPLPAPASAPMTGPPRWLWILGLVAAAASALAWFAMSPRLGPVPALPQVAQPSPAPAASAPAVVAAGPPTVEVKPGQALPPAKPGSAAPSPVPPASTASPAPTTPPTSSIMAPHDDGGWPLRLLVGAGLAWVAYELWQRQRRRRQGEARAFVEAVFSA